MTREHMTESPEVAGFRIDGQQMSSKQITARIPDNCTIIPVVQLPQPERVQKPKSEN